MKITPLKLKLILHLYCDPSRPIPNAGFPAVEEALREFAALNLIRWDLTVPNYPYVLTERGLAWIDMLRSTPLPEHRWGDPRTEGTK